MEIGPVSREQLARFGKVWQQGEHVLISGPTGSGKTTLARQVVEQRIQRGGFVVNFVMKPAVDLTILKEYKGWRRWTEMRKRGISPHDNKILLWPKVEGLPASKAREIQKEVFAEAFDILSIQGKWTVQVDEGLYTCAPTFLGLGQPLAMSHSIGRSSDLTMVTLTQRPAHLPLIVYSSASHAFVGQTREGADLKRLAELDGVSSRELAHMLSGQGRKDFIWVPVSTGDSPERLNLKH